MDEFYEECARLQELIRKVKIKKAINKFLLKTWKENIEDTEDHLMESVSGDYMSDLFLLLPDQMHCNTKDQ